MVVLFFSSTRALDAFVSAYAAQSLAQATAVGIPINSAMVSRLERVIYTNSS
jgi:uncharacterized protein YfaS (alpha-2-macroglobulin family)